MAGRNQQLNRDGSLYDAHNVYCDNCKKFYRGEPSAVIEQFSGLVDRNEVEIFDGDIVRVMRGQIGKILRECIEVVEWDDRWHSWKFRDKPCVSTEWMVLSERLTVIGNIHEHPHLLEDRD